MDNRRRFQHAGLLKGTGKNQIFVTSGEQAFNHGIEDDHIPFEKKGQKICSDQYITPYYIQQNFIT